ncbi:MAG: efflux RND transporter periplasmic adaptor subunit [Acholeplasma sp.]|nr:efflux RND transporter periplasmic adaptor subunit [Acholeplasma sp.]
MRGKIVDFKDLSESREVIEHKVPRFMLWFFYFVLVTLALLLVWSYFGEKEIIVQANGRVQSENIQIVTPLVTSRVETIYFKEGDLVQESDLILELDGTEIETDILNYTNALSKYQDNLILEELYLESVQTNENLFSLNEISQITKYYEMDAYLEEYENSEDQERTRNEKIASLTSSMDQMNATITQYENEISKLENQLSNYKVYANYNGIIHYTNPVSVGSAIQAGYELLRVYEETDDRLEVQFYVLNSDIAKIEIGQNVRVEIPALSPRTYGYASAEVILIESDSRVDQQSGQSFYIITARLNETSLHDEDILIGMQVQSRMIVDSQRYLFWAIEKLELWIFE